MRIEQNRGGSTLVGGIIIVLIGVLLLFDQMGILRTHWFNFWAFVCMIGGVLKITNSADWGGRLWGILLLAFGAALEVDQLGYATIHIDKIWPIFVIAAGLVLVWKAYERPRGPDSGLSPHLNLFCCMGGGEYRIRAQNFRGGNVMALMGGFDIDLREADIEGSEATINANAFMGGGVIRVPENWAVLIRGSSIMGGHSLKIREGAQVQKTLVVDGIVLLGGVEVRN